MKKVNIYTDGAAKGNPGRGGYGTIVSRVNPDGTIAQDQELSVGYLYTTNNRMEMMAAIAGLQQLNEPYDVCITSDSRYLVDAFNKHWVDSWIRNGWRTSTGTAVKNIDLWQKLLVLLKPHQVKFVWVKGHNNHPMNERCDYLATTAANGVHLRKDEGVTVFF